MPEPAAENRRYSLLRLGLGCDAACLFCNVPAESYAYPMRLSTSQAARRIDALAAAGADRLELSGGEPSLRADLERLVARARGAGFSRVELQTNGVALARTGRGAALRRAGLTHAFVALHSHLPVVHDGLVRRPGAWEACVRSVRALIEAGVEVVLNPVLTAAQGRSAADYVRFVAASLPGVRAISLSVVQPHGRAAARPRLVPRYAALSPHVAAALDEADRLGLRVTNPFCGLPLCFGGWSRRLDRCVEWSESLLGRTPGDGMKAKPAACGGCALSAGCGGLWTRYLELDPEPGVRPVAAGEALA